MNIHIASNVVNMEAFARTFLIDCRALALQDGVLDRDEIKQLKIIEKATEKYLKALSKCK